MEEAQVKQNRSFYKEWIEPFLIAAVIALVIRQFALEAFKIPSGSMIPTLTVGDHLLVNKFVYGPRIPFTDRRIFAWKTPQRGDIIVFKYPQDESKNYIKRVIGVPGDKIQMVKGVLSINDQPVEVMPADPAGGMAEKDQGAFPPKLCTEQLGSVRHSVQYLVDQSDKGFEPIVVPQESVFVMGDNRDNSTDSRVWGFVKFDKILGRAFVIYWSWDGKDRWIRWERIGRLIR